MATRKQIDFAKDLLQSRVHDIVIRSDTLAMMSPVECSRLIDRLLACPRKPREPRPRSVEIEAGIYTDGESIAKVQKAVHGSGNMYAKRLVVTKDASGFVPYTAEFVYEAGLITKIYQFGWRKMTLEEAEKFGQVYGVCCSCGRTLTNEESIARGIGPICAGRF